MIFYFKTLGYLLAVLVKQGLERGFTLAVKIRDCLPCGENKILLSQHAFFKSLRNFNLG